MNANNTTSRPFAWDSLRGPMSSSEIALHGYYLRTSAWPWHCINQARRILFSLETEFSKTTEEGRRILRRVQGHLKAEDEKRLYIQAMANINT